MMRQKTVAAAVAAVTAYIQSEEAFALQSAPRTASQKPAESFSSWRLSGRQDQMQMRTQMQLKAYYR